jgi:hypothetical protein
MAAAQSRHTASSSVSLKPTVSGGRPARYGASRLATDGRNYLGRVTKARILEAVREGAGEDRVQLIDHLKKDDMAREAERLLADHRPGCRSRFGYPVSPSMMRPKGLLPTKNLARKSQSLSKTMRS